MSGPKPGRGRSKSIQSFSRRSQLQRDSPRPHSKSDPRFDREVSSEPSDFKSDTSETTDSESFSESASRPRSQREAGEFKRFSEPLEIKSFEPDASETTDSESFSEIASRPRSQREAGETIIWDYTEAAKFMNKRKAAKTLKDENKANAVVWFNTLFQKAPVPFSDLEQDRVLSEQQAFLKRHFLAMAVLGLQGGKQEDDRTYVPLEQWQDASGARINLATVASGGGRLNYRSTDGSGNELIRFLIHGDQEAAASYEDFLKNLPGERDRKKIALGETYPLSKAPLGGYYRTSTHTESFRDGKILEGKGTFIPGIGFSFPIGGLGQKLKDAKGREVITGYQGRSMAETDTPGKKIDYQTGAGLIRHAESGDGRTNTLIAFEGSAPNTDNIFGGGHGAGESILKFLKLKESEFTLTGQRKRGKWGLYRKDLVDEVKDLQAVRVDEVRRAKLADKSQKELVRRSSREKATGEKEAVDSLKKAVKEEWGNLKDNGSLKVDVTNESLKGLKKIWGIVDRMNPVDQEVFFQKLLVSETQAERDLIVRELIGSSGDQTIPQVSLPEDRKLESKGDRVPQEEKESDEELRRLQEEKESKEVEYQKSEALNRLTNTLRLIVSQGGSLPRSSEQIREFANRLNASPELVEEAVRLYPSEQS